MTEIPDLDHRNKYWCWNSWYWYPPFTLVIVTKLAIPPRKKINSYTIYKGEISWVHGIIICTPSKTTSIFEEEILSWVV